MDNNEEFIEFNGAKISIKKLINALDRMKDRDKVNNIPSELKQYPLTPDECYEQEK